MPRSSDGSGSAGFEGTSRSKGASSTSSSRGSRGLFSESCDLLPGSGLSWLSSDVTAAEGLLPDCFHVFVFFVTMVATGKHRVTKKQESNKINLKENKNVRPKMFFHKRKGNTFRSTSLEKCILTTQTIPACIYFLKSQNILFVILY